MAINKVEAGWLVDIQPGGRGSKRYRKIFPVKAEALAYEAFVKTKVSSTPEWAPAKRDLRTLSSLVDTWYKNHGIQLRAGVDTYNRLKSLCVAIGDPYVDRFNAGVFAEYRNARIAAGLSPNSMNREHAYLRSVFNELKRLGYWKGDNPLATVRQFKVAERELSYLSRVDIKRLLQALEDGRNTDALLITKICLSTGARWSEAEQLKPSQVRDGQIHFSNTKSGKNRSIPITTDMEAALARQDTKRGETGRLFMYSYTAFRDAIKKAGLSLPVGQLTHVLRHSFASHFMMNGGNILVLQRLLGHSSLTMTMRYAHLAPDHLQEARALNPLSNLE
jgi:integrase